MASSSRPDLRAKRRAAGVAGTVIWLVGIGAAQALFCYSSTVPILPGNAFPFDRNLGKIYALFLCQSRGTGVTGISIGTEQDGGRRARRLQEPFRALADWRNFFSSRIYAMMVVTGTTSPA